MLLVLLLTLCAANASSDAVVDMLGQINSIHLGLFQNFSALQTFPSLFMEEGARWLFPIGQKNSTQFGREGIHESLEGWASLLLGERSYMTQVMVAGNQGSYWWRDTYRRADNSDTSCMFQKQGWTSFNISESGDNLIDTMLTWEDLDYANEQNVACGLTAQKWAPPSVAIQNVFAIVSSFLTSGTVDNLILSIWDTDAVWREPMGRPDLYLSGKKSIQTLLSTLNSTYRWTSSLGPKASYDFDATGPMFSGNSVGFQHVITFADQSGCMYAVKEFVSIQVSDASGLITDFNVFYDEAQHEKAKSRCQ